MKACIKTWIKGRSRYSFSRNPSTHAVLLSTAYKLEKSSVCKQPTRMQYAKAYASSCSVCSCSVCSSSGFLIRYCMLYAHVAYAHLAASSYATRLHTLLPSKATPLNPDISTH